MHACYTRRADQLTVQMPTVGAHPIVHPLVVMNVSDHWTRSQSNAGSPNAPVLGVLLGQLLGERLSIVTSFELLVDKQCESSVSILEDKAKDHMARLVEVYPGMDAIGWYTCGSQLDADVHSAMHTRMTTIFENEAMVLLLMDGSNSGRRKTLPVFVFEQRGPVSAVPLEFASVEFSVEADALETIGINTAIQAESQAAATGQRTITAAATRAADAIGVLRDCIGVVMAYLGAIEAHQVEPDMELLRSIATLSNRLPSTSDPALLSAAKDREYMNAMLIVYLGVLGKTQATLQTLMADSASCSGDASRFHFAMRR